MPRYQKKVQVLLSEKQFHDLEEISLHQKKKLGTLVREAIEEYHLKKKKQLEITEAVDRLLSFPETPVPEDYQAWEKEYLEKKILTHEITGNPIYRRQHYNVCSGRPPSLP